MPTAMISHTTKHSSGGNVVNRFIDQRNKYSEQLKYIQPGRTIDALKDDIMHLLRDSKRASKKVEDLTNFIHKKREQISDANEKEKSAQRDRHELYRDLATFEFNFSKRNNREMFQRVDNMTQVIYDIKSKVSAIHSNTSLRGWLEENEIHDLAQAFQSIIEIQEAEKLLQNQAGKYALYSSEVLDEVLFAKRVYADFQRAFTFINKKKSSPSK